MYCSPVAVNKFVHTPMTYACLDCNAITDNKKRLAHHIVRDHGIDTEHFNGLVQSSLTSTLLPHFYISPSLQYFTTLLLQFLHFSLTSILHYTSPSLLQFPHF